MFYLAEGLYLFKRTWWPLVRLWLLSLGLMGLFVAGVIAIARAPGPLTAGGTFLLLGLSALLMIAGPAEWYATLAVMSSPYHEARPAVWKLLLAGLRKWWRIVGVLFIQLLVLLPFVIPMVLIAVKSGVKVSELPFGTRWLLQLLSPFTVLLTIYGAFAALNVVRLGHKARAAWWTALRLVPSQDWWRTVGVLAGAGILLGLAGEAFNQVIELLTPAGERYIASLGPGVALVLAVGLIVVACLSWLLSILLNWYLMLCWVAVWHRYAPPPETERLASGTPGNDVTIAPDITGTIRA